MSDSLQPGQSPVVNPPVVRSWEDLATRYEQYLEKSRRFLQAAQQSREGLAKADWPSFLAERDDILIGAEISLRRINGYYQEKTLTPVEQILRDKTAGLLKEVKILDDQLFGLLNALRADFQKALHDFARRRAVFKGYGGTGRRGRPNLFEQVG